MGKSVFSFSKILVTVAIGITLLSSLLSISPALEQTNSEIHASTLGEFFRKVFPGLKSTRRQATGPGETVGPGPSPTPVDPFHNYQPGAPPTDEELGNNNEISEAEVQSSVTISRFGACRVVTNLRGDIFSVMIPHLIREEWFSFIENPPDGITIGTCVAVIPTPTPTPVGPTPPPTGLCDRDLNPDEIYAVVGNLRLNYTAQAPMAGIAPRISARATSINYICQQMGCGPPEWIAYRTYSSPENNAIVRWTGSAWEKVRATEEPTKMDGCAATQERMLRCGPPGAPAGVVQRRNCDG